MRKDRAWRPLAAWAAAVALLAVFASPLWHHHDDGADEGAGDACSVCVAAAVPTVNTGAGAPDAGPVGMVVGCVAPFEGLDGSAGLVREHLARGPPRG